MTGIRLWEDKILLLVQCDFDDTITDGNVSVAIREVFGPDGWRSMEREFQDGKFSVEESNIRQYALLKASQKDIEDFVLGDVVLRFGFEQFVEYCRAVEIKVVIVSSGLDLYIDPVIQPLGYDDLEVYSAQAQVGEDGITVSYKDPSGAALTRGFKESYVRHFKKQGHTVVYVGDGLSDIVPASEADYVIARDTLEEHSRANGLSYHSFETYEDVAKRVEEIRKLVQG